MKTSKLLMIAASAAALAVAGSAQAATRINLIDIGGVAGSPAQQGFAIAARYWESVLTNNVTMNINVGFSNLGPGILGGTSTSLRQFVPISNYYNLLAANTAKSSLDTTALAGLRPLDANGSVNVLVPGYLTPATRDGITDTNAQRVAPTGEAISNTIAIASSNYKALVNDSSFGATSVDAQIQFSNTFAFDFDPTDGISAGSYDFIGVAIHEIGHALGFLSGADDFDYSAGSPGDVDGVWWGYALDMFRYSAPGQLNWSFDQEAFFSVNGSSAFNGSSFSTGEVNGDGWQASHWKAPAGCTGFIGIMNPYICSATVDSVRGNDLALFDAIGWNVNVDVTSNPNYSFSTAQAYRAFANTAVPEPATWAMMIAGFGLVGSAMRRRRTSVAFAA